MEDALTLIDSVEDDDEEIQPIDFHVMGKELGLSYRAILRATILVFRCTM